MTKIQRLEKSLSNALSCIDHERATWGVVQTRSGMVRSMNKISEYEATVRYCEDQIRILDLTV